MHYEVLVEGQCELTALSILFPKLLGQYGEEHTWKIHKHQGKGVLPADGRVVMATDRTLLGQLPSKIKAYCNVPDDQRRVIVLMDLDQEDRVEFETQLMGLIPPGQLLDVVFCFAVEELEAWFLGDQDALVLAYPDADINECRNYVQDSICGTWEVLAKVLKSGAFKFPKRDQRLLKEKCGWAKKISPHMDVNLNLSPSFNEFKGALS